MIKAYGHAFQNFKAEEMICWNCGYVIWRVNSDEEAKLAMEQLAEDGVVKGCGGAWHKFIPVDILQNI